MKRTIKILPILLVVILLLCGCQNSLPKSTPPVQDVFTDSPYVTVYSNIPVFSDSELTVNAYEQYGELDSLGRCTKAIASLGTELMPTEERGSIGQVKPSGWHTVKYDIVDGKYLYNRCHLIGFQLSGENANVKNLITGTRYLNVEGMLPFENMVADYIKETQNHVAYRVTPVFEGDNLVASGVQIEAQSVEDSGEGIQFNVYCYNVQPGIEIDYATGQSFLSETENTSDETDEEFILNTNSKKYHKIDCKSANSISEKNKKKVKSSKQQLENDGYVAAACCNP